MGNVTGVRGMREWCRGRRIERLWSERGPQRKENGGGVIETLDISAAQHNNRGKGAPVAVASATAGVELTLHIIARVDQW